MQQEAPIPIPVSHQTTAFEQGALWSPNQQAKLLTLQTLRGGGGGDIQFRSL